MRSTPSDRHRRALDVIVEHIDLARSFAAGMDATSLAADLRTYLAVTRAIEIVSEATRRLDPAFRDAHPGIPWRDIASVGNVYRHQYEDVDPGMVLATLSEPTEALRAAVAAEIARLGG